jgi:hypothetical protein
MDNMHHNHVVIFIDKKKHESPNPTTGGALYVLGGVDPNTYDLYREVHGKGDDELIRNDSGTVILKDGDHLFTIQKKLNPGVACR